MAAFDVGSDNGGRKGRLLVLHFDINKTILMADPVSGCTIDDMVNSLLTECIWGVVNKDKVRYKDRDSDRDIVRDDTNLSVDEKEIERSPQFTLEDWTMVSSVPSMLPPGENLVTLGYFLEFYANTSREERKKIKYSFTDGELGRSCRSYFEELKSKLTLPEELEISGLDMLSSGVYHIIPAFFNMVIELDRREWDFRIIFRTFGVDIANIAKEFNMFCEGKHPLYPNVRMDGSDKIVAIPKDFNTFHLTNSVESSNAKASSNSLDRRLLLPYGTATISRKGPNKEDVLFSHVSSDNTVKVEVGAFNIYNLILKWMSLSTNSIGIQVCYY
jgi:hypothetical protein